MSKIVLPGGRNVSSIVAKFYSSPLELKSTPVEQAGQLVEYGQTQPDAADGQR
ncbi:hypothetical protein LB565_10000 [Mesorhizobium sp. CA14]|uniref:hypothetical protein n=1 Tax=Mesorhizobium sp. CA14 TaxID=2876642 RepID=UPI001CCDE0D8|nr:hypothetical protein [Mesorhizobium sp. CA14]MBZ9848313.1 hypothetical protein [Mesorhizobium sp. CA14]